MQESEGRQVGTKDNEAKYKWRFAVGTTSRVPGAKGLHYLILDIDDKQHPANLLAELWEIGFRTKVQPTENGWHIFTDAIFNLDGCGALALRCGADIKWVELAMKRGYFFLADKKRVSLEWPVERMVIYRGQEGKEIDTNRA